MTDRDSAGFGASDNQPHGWRPVAPKRKVHEAAMLRLAACGTVAALLTGCGGSSGHGHQRDAFASSTTSASQTATSGSVRRVETITRNGAVLVVSPGVAYSVESQDQPKASTFAPGDTVTVNEEEDITDVRTGRRVSATEIGETTEANRYPHAGSRHKLATRSTDGGIVVLNDESVWAVAPAERSTAASWAEGASIAVPKSAHLLYGLVNSQNHSTIRASYIGEEEA
jgi:hypothetical protein